MRVFVTGATGFVGSAVVRELLDAGHHVLGLARSDSAAATLTSAGAEVHRGDLDDLDSLRRGAAAADGVVHTAFTNISDTTDFAASCRTDTRAVEALGEALVGSDRPLAITSATGVLPTGGAGTEDSPPDPGSLPALRIASEEAVLALAERGVRTSVVRLPQSVHGEQDRAGFIPLMISIARTTGVSAYVGDGSSRWAAVHRRDTARLFRLAVESAPAGARLHAIGDEGVPVRDIAQAIGRRLNLPVTGMSQDEADGHFGFLGAVLARDSPASSTRTQQRLGWQPVQPGLIADIEDGHYFTVQ
ncbi:SDR family oxidoreductase [Streptomyces hyaluromycini]|uniref:SDR family oxidoreductase n=1 Tax=Streptomyces hyaluromycini TaxID=1377993 RepID=UPI000B5C905F|nr:SDR family oxidoreductase [Streptomyces hyaluromycini]